MKCDVTAESYWLIDLVLLVLSHMTLFKGMNTLLGEATLLTMFLPIFSLGVSVQESN